MKVPKKFKQTKKKNCILLTIFKKVPILFKVVMSDF